MSVKDMIDAVLAEKPLDFEKAFDAVMREKASEAVAEYKPDVAAKFLAPASAPKAE